MVFKDTQLKIYQSLKKEWYSDLCTFRYWDDFIEAKKLGVLYDTTEHTNDFVDYIIIDSKKWFLTRLKYGI